MSGSPKLFGGGGANCFVTFHVVLSFKNGVDFFPPFAIAFFDRFLFATMDSSKKRISGKLGFSIRSSRKRWKSCVFNIFSRNNLDPPP